MFDAVCFFQTAFLYYMLIFTRGRKANPSHNTGFPAAGSRPWSLEVEKPEKQILATHTFR